MTFLQNGVPAENVQAHENRMFENVSNYEIPVFSWIYFRNFFSEFLQGFQGTNLLWIFQESWEDIIIYLYYREFQSSAGSSRFLRSMYSLTLVFSPVFNQRFQSNLRWNQTAFYPTARLMRVWQEWRSFNSYYPNHLIVPLISERV